MCLLPLRDCMQGASEGKGSSQGQAARSHLEMAVSRSPASAVFGLSLEGVSHMDSVFARVAILELAVVLRRRKAFFLLGVEDPDLLENIDNAARRCHQPLYLQRYNNATSPLLLGPAAPVGTEAMLCYVQTHTSVCASEAVGALHLSIQNASNKLKVLWEAGYCLREARCASSGGREYTYTKIV